MNSENRIPVFGLGPGKSATASLALFFNAQPGMVGIHEGRFGIKTGTLIPDLIHWDYDMAGVDRHFDLLKKCAVLRERQTGVSVTHIGEVAMYYLQYVKYIHDRHPLARFVCIKRDPEQVIASWLDVTNDSVRHWTKGGTKGWLPPLTKIFGRKWDVCFPKYENMSHEEACRKYVVDYYKQIDNLKKTFPFNVKVFEMDDFTSESGRHKILDAIGYKGERVVTGDFHEHKERWILKNFSGKV